MAIKTNNGVPNEKLPAEVMDFISTVALGNTEIGSLEGQAARLLRTYGDPDAASPATHGIEDREARVAQALEDYNRLTGDPNADNHQALTDLLADAMHALGVDEVQGAFDMAQQHYEAEADGQMP